MREHGKQHGEALPHGRRVARQIDHQHALVGHAAYPAGEDAARLLKRCLPSHCARQPLGRAGDHSLRGLGRDVARPEARAARREDHVEGAGLGPRPQLVGDVVLAVREHLQRRLRDLERAAATSRERRDGLQSHRAGLVLVDSCVSTIRARQHSDARLHRLGAMTIVRQRLRWRGIAILAAHRGVASGAGRRGGRGSGRREAEARAGLRAGVLGLGGLKHRQLLVRGFCLVFLLPLCIRLAIDVLASLVIGHGHAVHLGASGVPLGQAIAAEPCQVHDVDVLHI
mmetsp:Transcript_110229/g.306527  ORF Transcript_110229/g.306527 Transcript_110229/m.306527 type:complete len:284 (+) Transcript_110229:113-964(+)